MIKVISKEFLNADLQRECTKEYEFSNSFVDSLRNALAEFVYKCKVVKHTTHQYVISFKFSDKKDTVDCVYYYNPYLSRKYQFYVYGFDFSFRNRTQLIDWVSDLLSNNGCK